MEGFLVNLNLAPSPWNFQQSLILSLIIFGCSDPPPPPSLLGISNDLPWGGYAYFPEPHIPGPGIICGLSLLLVFVLALRVFLQVLQFSSLTTLPNSNSIENSKCHRFVSPRTVKCNSHKIKLIYLFVIYLFIYLLMDGWMDG